MNENKKYQIGLSLINGVGSVNAKKLLAYVGSAEGIFKEKKQNLLKIPGIGKQLAEEILSSEVQKRADDELKFIEKHNIQTFFFTDKLYPGRLKQYDDSPILLYYKGTADLNQQKTISIVGTRKASQYGLENCKKLINDLIEKGHKVLVISGLAYGIDIAAHKAALKLEQETIAVLGHGLNMIYPAVHRTVAQEIVKQGGLLTELSSSAVLDPGHFVKRNRIIAGLADATIVIESGEKGGSLITAKIANDYNKDVFAFPGRINDKYSMGCNKLIKTNQAALIESAEDVEYILGWKASKKNEATQTQLFIELNPEEESIVKYLKENGKTPIDILAMQSNMPMSKISSILLKLEFAGAVMCHPGKIFEAAN